VKDVENWLDYGELKDICQKGIQFAITCQSSTSLNEVNYK